MNRYARQLALPEVGEEGQHRLRRAKVLVIGAGALGCPVLQYLTGAGVGRLTLVDADRVARSNLHRQPLYGESDVGQAKVWAAQARLRDLNSSVDLQARAERLDPANAAQLVRDADVVVDCADSFAVTYILSDTARTLCKPLVSASVLGFGGYVGGFCAGAPSVRAVFPELPASSATCATAGVLGPVAALVGCVQAQMVLGVLLRLQPSPLGQMVVADLRTYSFRSFRFDAAREPDIEPAPFIAPAHLAPTDFVVDLRSVAEAPVLVHSQAVRKTVDDFRRREVIPDSRQRAVLCCRSGLRAWHAAAALRSYWSGAVALLAAGDDSTADGPQRD